jgi:broad specificity phosphatase PhoE
MTMLRIVLIHPGSTDYDEQRRVQGSLDIPLSDQGNNEVVRLIEQLRDQQIETIYSPSCQPAEQTAAAIARRLDIKLKTFDRMQNLDQGLWEGMLIEDVKQKQPKAYKQWQEQPENVCPPGGEMLSGAADRVRTAMTKLLKKHKEGTIAVVAPEPLASLVRQFLSHKELGDLWKAPGSHGQWEVLEIQPEEAITKGG